MWQVGAGEWAILDVKVSNPLLLWPHRARTLSVVTPCFFEVHAIEKGKLLFTFPCPCALLPG